MVESCYLCKAKRKKGLISLHAFPKDKDLLKHWMVFCKLEEDINDVRTLKLCSNHFVPEDFFGYPNNNYPKILKQQAIPSLYFNHKRKRVDKSELINCKKHPCVVQEASSCVENEVDVHNSEPSTSKDTVDEVNIHHPEPSTSKQVIIAEKEIIEGDIEIVEEEINIDNSDITNEINEENSTPRRNRRSFEPRFLNEIDLKDFNTPRRGKRTLQLIKSQNLLKNKKIHNLQKVSQRLRKKVCTLQNLLIYLRKQGLIEQSAADSIMDILPLSVQHILERQMKKGKYSPELRSFALTLYFYSPKSYNYVRNYVN